MHYNVLHHSNGREEIIDQFLKALLITRYFCIQYFIFCFDEILYAYITKEYLIISSFIFNLIIKIFKDDQ